MAHDYNLQLENLRQLKRLLVALIDEFNQLDGLYAHSLEASHQEGVTLQMYEKFRADNLVRVHSEFSKLVNDIQTNDLVWIRTLEDGFEAVLNAASADVLASGTVSESDITPATTSATSAKVEAFEKATQKLRAKAAIASVLDPGREERQRDMHADYLAAFNAARQKSR